MQTTARGRNGDASAGKAEATNGTGAKGRGEPRFAATIIPQMAHDARAKGRVLLVLELGSSPTVIVEAPDDKTEHELAGLVERARWLARLAGEWVE